jgi:hypothetical protein
MGEVFRIAGHDFGVQAAGEQYDACINDIITAALFAKHAHGLSFGAIKYANVDNVRCKQAGEARLLSAVPPNLGDNARWDVQHAAVGVGEFHQGANLFVVPFKGD